MLFFYPTNIPAAEMIAHMTVGSKDRSPLSCISVPTLFAIMLIFHTFLLSQEYDKNVLYLCWLKRLHPYIIFQSPRPDSPGLPMKEKTALATYHVARTIAKQKPASANVISGRLLKAKYVWLGYRFQFTHSIA